MNWNSILEWIWEIAAGVALALLVRRFLCLTARVRGTSMLETLRSGDVIFAPRCNRRRKPRRFDVVLCRYPGRKGLFVKRVVALPGERVALVEGMLHIDGAPVPERFPLRPTRQTTPERQLGPGEYFVLGDNRPCSHDSRSPDVGPLPERYILAIVTRILFPPGRWGRL